VVVGLVSKFVQTPRLAGNRRCGRSWVELIQMLRTGNLRKSRRGGPAFIVSIPPAVALRMRITLIQTGSGTGERGATGYTSDSLRESRSDGISWVDSIRAGSLHESWRGARITRNGRPVVSHDWTPHTFVPNRTGIVSDVNKTSVPKW